MEKSLEEIQHLMDMVQYERTEEEVQYQALINDTTIGHRRKMGVCWYPVVIENEEIGMGEQWILDIQRTGHEKIYHHFSSGQTAELFCNAYEGNERLAVKGVIRRIRGNNIQLIVKNDDLPEWIADGKLGLDMLYNEATFKEMEFALQRLSSANQNRLAELREILFGFKKPSFSREHYAVDYPDLNASQNRALAQIGKAEDIAIIHGPPGTGKTTTIVKAIQACVKTTSQVLVCAPSNTAVDLLSQKLVEQGVKVVRLGHPARVNEQLFNHTLDAQITAHPDYKQLKQTRKQVQQVRKKAWKFKKHFGKEEREERRALLTEAREMLDYARNLEQSILAGVLQSAQVITCTLVVSSSRIMRDRFFDTVFIDEAGQALEPATWIPICRANRVVLAGDHFQLPPTVKSMDAQKGGLMTSLFEKCITRLAADIMLDTQYRMNEKIMQFSSQEFYDKKLAAHESVSAITLGEDMLLGTPVDFIDTAGCGYTEKKNENTLSTGNLEEAQLLYKYLGMVMTELIAENAEQAALTTIGIISPYKEQVTILRDELVNQEVLLPYKDNIAIHTVDGFQGQERDVIAISMVRSNDNGEIGFLSDIRRMNVAMTRAKRKLIMVGDSATLGNHSYYKRLMKYIDKIEAYHSAWEFMY